MAKKNRKKSTFFSDFKAFITKGNVMDMAVGVVIGTAFSAIVNSLVKDIIMPLLNLATGNGVEGLSVVLNGVDKYLPDGTINPEAILWNYGNFLQSIINFLIIALCIFTTLRIIMNIKKAKDKISDMAKRDKKADEQVLTEQTQAAQEAVADVAEEVKEEKPAEEQAVAAQDVAPNEVTAEATESEGIEQKAEEPVEEKETQEDLLKQIRDLLATMQPQKKSEAKTTSAKKSTKSAK